MNVHEKIHSSFYVNATYIWLKIIMLSAIISFGHEEKQ